MSDTSNIPPLPHRTARYITDPNEMTEAGVRGMISNPVYAGIPPYERIVSDEVWVRSAVQLIEEEGIEQFLVNMLYMLRNSMVDIVPEEAIPPSYDGPWPDEETEGEDFLETPEQKFPPSPWHNPLEGVIYCTHDDSPMIVIEGEFVCVSKYLYAHLDGSPITDLIAEPVLTLIFQNGHTLPLLCPDCGQSLHIDDHSELLDDLNGLTITGVAWDAEMEALIIELSRPEDPESREEPEEALLLHLDSVRELTCPHQPTWVDETEE